MRRLHNPSGVRLSAEFLHENIVIAREDVGLRDNVHVDVASELILLCEWRVLTLKVLAVSFDVLDHQVFLTQLVGVGEMVQNLVVRKTEPRIRVENLAFDCPGQSPIDVPFVLVGGAGPAPTFEISDEDAFFEICSEFELSGSV